MPSEYVPVDDMVQLLQGKISIAIKTGNFKTQIAQALKCTTAPGVKHL